jgi:hypothetical protein
LQSPCERPGPVQIPITGKEGNAMAKRKSKRATKRKSKRSTTAARHLIGIRLTPAMRDALDEVALEWRTTRSAVMRELIAHALKSPPTRKS